MNVNLKRTSASFLQLAVGAAISALVTVYLLFETSIGDGMPNWFKYAVPIGSWLGVIGFFYFHRSDDGKHFKFRIW